MESSRFLPEQAAPGKVRDRGLAALVERGRGAYNAKDGALFLLPQGRAERTVLREKLCFALESAGAVPVEGATEEGHLRSLAERYLRDHPDRNAWASVGQGEIRLAAWCREGEDASGLERVLVALTEEEKGNGAFRTFPETTPQGIRILWAAPSSEGAGAGRPGLRCPSCGTLLGEDSPREGAVRLEEGEEPGTLAEVTTPGATTIPELCRQLGIEAERTLKTLVFSTPSGVAAALLRGDRELSCPKLERALGEPTERAAHDALVRFFGDVAGYCGPLGLPPEVRLLADRDLEGARNLVAGANRRDTHVMGVCLGRDLTPPLADLGAWKAGDPCPDCGALLEEGTLRVLGAFELFDPGRSPEKPLVTANREGKTERPRFWRGRIDLEALQLALEEGTSPCGNA